MLLRRLFKLSALFLFASVTWASKTPPSSSSAHQLIMMRRPPRGGERGNRRLNNRKPAQVQPACSDSNAVLTIKTAVSAATETVALLAVLKGGILASPKVNHWLADNKRLSFLPTDLPTRLALLLIIFSSSTIKSWVDGSVGAATSQVSMPNTVPGDASWYQNLKKPWFTPPGWVFPIMWLIVSKPTQFIAMSKLLLGKSSGGSLSSDAVDAATTAAAEAAEAVVSTSSSTTIPWGPALTVYCAHLALGDAWNEVFFGCQRIGLGAVVISTFLVLLLTSAKLFSDVQTAAGLFLLPTCAWVCVATALNLAFYRLNRSQEKN